MNGETQGARHAKGEGARKGRRRGGTKKEEDLMQEEEENIFPASWAQVCIWQWCGVGPHLPYRLSKS